MDDLLSHFDTAIKRFSEVGFEPLTELEKMLVVIWGLESEVNNGGFDQYYFNEAGEHANYAPHALRSIGALKMAGIVEKANAIFGPSGPPTIWNDRQNILLEITADDHGPWTEMDTEFQSYPDDISSLLKKYIEDLRHQ